MALCSAALNYSLDSTLKVNNIAVRKEIAMGRTLKFVTLKMLDFSYIFFLISTGFVRGNHNGEHIIFFEASLCVFAVLVC